MTADVAIVGAGPAGAWAARALASAGARVVILDASHPREKPCGGGITGRALELIQAVVGHGSCAGVVADSVHFEADGSSLMPTVPLPSERLTSQNALVIVSRAAFDRWLLDHAITSGACHVPERVMDLTMDGGGACLTTSGGRYLAAHVIGADGAMSIVRKRLGRPFSRAQLSIAAGYFVHGTSSRDITIRCVSQPAGYIWSFPRTDHLAVGICAQADTVPNSQPLRAVTREWIERASLPVGAHLVPYTWPIPSLSAADLRSNFVAGPRWLLVGDAAGLVDPLTREGIFFALRSAEMASQAILEGPDRAHLVYETRLEKEIYPELRRAASMTAQFFTPAFSSLLLRALDDSPRIRRITADLIAGRQTYHGLRRRLLATREFGLALRFAGTRVSAIWPGIRRAPVPSRQDAPH